MYETAKFKRIISKYRLLATRQIFYPHLISDLNLVGTIVTLLYMKLYYPNLYRHFSMAL